ncbi:MAG: hypothetical protein R6U98_18915 [Pirellulaceae bacterium]
MESCPAQAVLPPVGLAADNIIRDRYNNMRFPAAFSLKTRYRFVDTVPDVIIPHDTSFIRPPMQSIGRVQFKCRPIPCRQVA